MHHARLQRGFQPVGACEARTWLGLSRLMKRRCCQLWAESSQAGTRRRAWPRTRLRTPQSGE
jgi:hypothetical protein